MEDEEDGLANQTIATEDLLAVLKEPGVPPHALHLKEGAMCSIMRNLSVDKGLVKNARVVIQKLLYHCVAVRLLQSDDQEVYHLPRITFRFSPKGTNFEVSRRQLPLRLCYASTMNSSQGLTLDRAVVNLQCPVFAHGQLYTAFSRVRRQADIRILLPDDVDLSDWEATNIVYPELLVPA